MLFVDGKPLCSIELSAVLQIHSLVSACSAFLEQLTHPCTAVPAGPAPCLCLCQGEEATVDAGQLPGLIIGSQDATTCLVAVIACPSSNLVWAAHVDQSLGSEDIHQLSSTLQRMQHPHLYMAGSYCDHNGAGPATAQSLLQLLHSLPQPLHLQLCCCGSSNTAQDGSPLTCQLALDTATQLVHPWTFADRGPEVPRRFAAHACRYYSNCTLLNVWCSQKQQLVLQPFDPTMLSSWSVLRYEQMLTWQDKQLLHVMSTSPDHEPHYFCDDMRNKMRFLIEAQELGSAARNAASSTARYAWSSLQSSWIPELEAAAHANASICATVIGV